MTTLSHMRLMDGAKSIPLSQLPEEAWQYISGQPQGSKLTTLSAYQAVPWLYRAVDLRAKAVASMPYAILRGESDVTDSAEWQSLRQTMRRNLLRTEGALCLYGASYLLPEKNGFGMNLTPRWLLPQTIEPQYDTVSGLAGFRRRLQGQNGAVIDRFFLPDEMVYCWLPALDKELGPGQAPAAVALAAAGVTYNLQQFLAAYFERGAIKATLLSVPKGTQPRERERLKSWWQRAVSGIKNAFSTEVVNAEVTPVVVGEGVKDLENAELTDEQREEIATALGVPHSLLFSNATNYATAQQDDLHFYTKTIIPQCELISEHWNEQLFEPLGLTLEFQPKHLELFQAAELEKAQAIQKAVGKPVLTRNEGRELLGYDPVDGWDAEDGGAGETEDPDATKDILGYHIETGVVTRNEARADVGLPPVDSSEDDRQRTLKAQLDLMKAAKEAGLSLEDAAELVGLEIALTPPPVPPVMSLPGTDLPPGGSEDSEDAAERDEDLKRFERKALKALRRGDSPAVPFESEWIDDAELKAIGAALAMASDVEEVRAAFSVLPFRLGWESYP